MDAVDSDLQGIGRDSWSHSTYWMSHDLPSSLVRTSLHCRWLCPTLPSILRRCWILRIRMERRWWQEMSGYLKDPVSSFRWPESGSEAPGLSIRALIPASSPLPRHIYPPEGGGGPGDYPGHGHQAEPGPAAEGPQGVLGPGRQGEGDRWGR